MIADQPTTRVLTGRTVILGFVLFFAVLIGVQAAFITIAVSTHTGLVSQQPYRKGLNYGERIAVSREQKERQWSEEVRLSENKKSLIFALRDRAGQPVRFLNLTAVLSRPVHKNEDQTLKFTETSDGLYTAPLTYKDPGAFVVDLEARRRSDGDPIWRTRRRVWIKP